MLLILNSVLHCGVQRVVQDDGVEEGEARAPARSIARNLATAWHAQEEEWLRQGMKYDAYFVC